MTTAVLADLDDTLFDHAHATRHALKALQAAERTLAEWPIDDLFHHHNLILDTMHPRVLARELTVDEARLVRFARLLRDAGADESEARAVQAAAIYRHAYEQGWRAVPGATQLLDRLRAEGCRIVVVTNNGVVEQRLKLDRCDLIGRIDALVTSEEVGTPKPGKAIFDAALAQAGAAASGAVMVGDAWHTDVEGARQSGIRAVWYNPRGLASPDPNVAEIRALAPADDALMALLAVPAR
ncbi:MAG TPA: HAD-IA family hydrolase [Vicinamibacterales bacterium]|nr:HAD-IA family hydrolase [Vicinamibacterales bacterium]